MIRQRRHLAILLAISLIAYSGYGFACNKQNTLASAAEAAKDISGGAGDVALAIGKAYQSKLITLAQKDELIDLVDKIVKGTEKGIDAIEKLQQQGVTNPSAEQRSILNRLFDDEVIAPFLNLLVKMGRLSDDSAIAIRTALASVRTAIILFSNRVGRNDTIKLIESIKLREVWNA